MARKMNGLSMQGLSDLLDNKISKQAISRYENGDMLPERANFLDLIKVLKVKEDFFHRGKSIELNPSFRKMKDLPKQQQEAIIERTKDYLERYLETESIVAASEARFKYKSDIRCQTVEHAEQAAEEFRKEYQLGTDPIFNLTELLEDLGIKVFQYNFENDDISGMSAWVNEEEGIAVIFVNTSHPIDRQRFTVAHELGHLILNMDKSLSNSNIEKCCDRFAAALLIPKNRMYQELGTKRKSIHLKELVFIKEQYGISPQALLYRAKDLDIISEHHRRQKFEYLKSSGLYKKPIGNYSGAEKTNQLLQLLCRGLAEETLSMAKAASLYGQRVADFRDTIALK
jgi:Zn-dependent peptidase ImmA (M78 family)